MNSKKYSLCKQRKLPVIRCDYGGVSSCSTSGGSDGGIVSYDYSDSRGTGMDSTDGGSGVCGNTCSGVWNAVGAINVIGIKCVSRNDSNGSGSDGSGSGGNSRGGDSS